MRGLSLRHDPVVGGSELELYGIGFFDSPTLVVRFQVTNHHIPGHILYRDYINSI